MKCKCPIVFKKAPEEPRPCGQCQHCRINKRRVWTHRIVLEARHHSENAFLTVTYDDDHLPLSFSSNDTGQVYSDYSVVPDHHEKFMKDLREAWRKKTGKKIRFFMVAEYGDKSGRPHYHYALFGFPSCPFFRSDYRRVRFEPCKCSVCSFISNVWGKGIIVNARLEMDSAQYIAGYTLKKLTSDKTEFQQGILQGRHPEFVRMSNRPGIGYQAVVSIIESLTRYGKLSYGDLPAYLNHGSKKLPLGRYMMDKMGGFTLDGKEINKASLFRQVVRNLLAHAKFPSQEAKAHAIKGDLSVAFELINQQYSDNLQSKLQLFNKEKMV